MAKFSLLVCLSLATVCFASAKYACEKDAPGPNGEASPCDGVGSRATDGNTGQEYCCPNGGGPSGSSRAVNVGGQAVNQYQCQCLTRAEMLCRFNARYCSDDNDK
ncbi:hypothetical protein RRG08_054416 [Elysia crispata]|uniref:Uncharacterized protein n=1 Tax=Elysia crispata TaxID=231223 RepID=A0AAE1E5I0_9GAST|nr:hypothetical protein RRG08_054416 [Elysia crispata]